ncbi:hypothetical protein V6N12_018980 [Hibiscus sabdariffa]|uniref:Uncharacterized protein n=1 Tax=Hibiscus sabdariffa TaxID=183260 RepID=A0ABR2B9N4_9ROSI
MIRKENRRKPVNRGRYTEEGVHARLRWFGLILNEGETELAFKDIETWVTVASGVSYISTTDTVSKIMELKADFTKLDS